MVYTVKTPEKFDMTLCMHCGTVGWRPAFKYYSMWLSLVGALLCIFVMFIMSWETALVTMAVIAVLFFYVHYRKPGTTTPRVGCGAVRIGPTPFPDRRY